MQDWSGLQKFPVKRQPGAEKKKPFQNGRVPFQNEKINGADTLQFSGKGW